MVPLKFPVKQVSPDYKEGNGMRVPVDCRKLVRRVGMLVWARLGHCSFCISRAFQATLVSWCLTALSLWFPIWGPLPTLSIGTACALTALWLGHLIAFALKASASAQGGASGARAASRRNVLQAFGHAFVTAAVVASVPGFALAQCNEATRAHCEAIASNCRANCNRSAHREEAIHACYQECYSNYVACKANAGCT
jgi:hypothetical protein